MSAGLVGGMRMWENVSTRIYNDKREFSYFSRGGVTLPRGHC